MQAIAVDVKVRTVQIIGLSRPPSLQKHARLREKLKLAAAARSKLGWKWDRKPIQQFGFL